MGKFTVRKASDASNNGFSETVAYHVMHQANVTTNHNKFYCIELQKNGKSHFRLFTHYGRLASSNIYEIRDQMEGRPITDEAAARAEFDSIHKKKLRGKTNSKTGERECYVDVDVVSPSVGSENIRGKSEKTVTVKTAIDTTSSDPRVAKLLDQLVDENIHNVTSRTSIKYTSNGFATELGPVTPQHVAKARTALDEVNAQVGKSGADAEDLDVQRANSAYYSLIPKPFNRKITEEDMILTSDAVLAEYDILDQLETAVTMGSAMAGSAGQRLNALGTDVEWVADDAEVRRIKKYIRNSRAANHRGSNVWDYEPVAIYRVCIPQERSRYDTKTKKYGRVQEVFHGSANCNLLSILKGGLIVPPSTAGHVTGRMFGNGLYGAINSTKSLNYSIGYWGSRRSSYRNAFLFLADFAMGKTEEVFHSVSRGASRGFNSIWAKKGQSLYNDELVVYDLSQCTLKYLVEMQG